MAISFKYRAEKFENKKRYFPKILAKLYNKGNAFQVPALLDSGATDIFVPKQIAEILELSKSKFEYADTWGTKLKVWNSRVGIVVGKGSTEFRKTLPCLILDKEAENEEVIFGREFFSFFEITFKEKERITVLKQKTNKINPQKRFRR